jgi:hypothetical protein
MAPLSTGAIDATPSRVSTRARDCDQGCYLGEKQFPEPRELLQPRSDCAKLLERTTVRVRLDVAGLRIHGAGPRAARARAHPRGWRSLSPHDGRGLSRAPHVSPPLRLVAGRARSKRRAARSVTRHRTRRGGAAPGRLFVAKRGFEKRVPGCARRGRGGGGEQQRRVPERGRSRTFLRARERSAGSRCELGRERRTGTFTPQIDFGQKAAPRDSGLRGASCPRMG